MCGWHPISVGQHWPKKNCMWIQTCRNIWEFLFSGRCFLHCSLWEHKSLAKMIVKRDISGSSSLSRLLLSIYHDHCGSHQWKSLCTLERSLTHYSWLYVFEPTLICTGCLYTWDMAVILGFPFIVLLQRSSLSPLLDLLFFWLSFWWNIPFKTFLGRECVE